MVAFHTEGQAFERDDLSEDAPLAMFIGPEGGWSPAELDLFHKNDIDIVLPRHSSSTGRNRSDRSAFGGS